MLEEGLAAAAATVERKHGGGRRNLHGRGGTKRSISIMGLQGIKISSQMVKKRSGASWPLFLSLESHDGQSSWPQRISSDSGITTPVIDRAMISDASNVNGRPRLKLARLFVHKHDVCYFQEDFAY